jgi:general secretion pathway protein D
MNKYLVMLFILVLSACALWSAGFDAKQQDQETVTFLESTNFNDAVQILETFSWRYERKKIINLSQVNDAIGIPIHNLTWRKALEMMVLKKGLVIEETVGAIITKNKEEVSKSGTSDLSLPFGSREVNTKQVRISGVAFTCDKAYLRSLGIDWSTILNGKVNAQINLNTAGLVPSPVLDASADHSWGLDNGYRLDVNTLINTIESNELGTIVARPSVVVSSGKKGYIQVGQDISIKTVDDAGNTTDKFFSTGVIMNVVPTILSSEPDSTEVIHLEVNVERSSATPGYVTTVINKNTATTDVILYNGEETAIAGLYNTEDLTTRSGIPILKDLPWWVFGIRYLTGYYKVDKKERELVIIIKADILDSALTRLKNKK